VRPTASSPAAFPARSTGYYCVNTQSSAAAAEWQLLQEAAATVIDPTRGTIMEDTNVLIQAAIDGLGVAMGSDPFVREHISTGRLVRHSKPP
jgi:DNA-binding transcriptional LysR family regulator